MVGVSERAQARPRIRLRLGDIARLVAVWLVSSAALALAGALLPNLTAEAWWAYFAATAVAGLLGLVFRPVLVLVTSRIGWLAVVFAGLVGQALLVYAAIWIVPGISATFWSAFWGSWIVAVVATAAAWLASAGTDDAFTASLLRRRVKGSPVADPEVDGVVFVQLDGVAFPVLRWAIQAGRVQTLRRWVTSGDYVLREWTAQLPCTTPASQLGILHGTVAGVPAFRWYDRELGRVLIANRPDDAAIIEQRATTGAGLLADDGLALGNLFTGDAPRAVLTMSRLGGGRSSAVARETFAWFLTNPNGFTRGVVRTIAELVKERWQADRQTRLNVLPRVHRGWAYAGLRAATNVLQRDLNTAVVAEEMRKGTKSIYVDYVDYDEIAHHAGMFRPESLAALDGLDRVLGTLERVSMAAARRYHIVVLSDHGQSQGQTFHDRFGTDLGQVCTQLMEEEVASIDASVEDWGRADSLAERFGRRRDYRQSRPARRCRHQPTRRPGRRSRKRGRRLGAGLGKPRPAVRAFLRPSHSRGSPGTLARPRARPVCTRGNRFRCRTGLCWCAVGPRRGGPRPARHRRSERTRPSRTVRRPCRPEAPARCRDAGGPRPVHQQPRQ